MKALLVRIAVDQAYGSWYAPAGPERAWDTPCNTRLWAAPDDYGADTADTPPAKAQLLRQSPSR